MFKFYQVGGCVRDEIMGIPCKDIDYVVVPDEELLYQTEDPSEIFYVLQDHLKKANYHIWQVTEDCFTIRSKFPPDHQFADQTADFVLARTETYVEGSRKPIVKIGSLYDDLRRRDFTVNAIAKDEFGNYIDPFEGIIDIKEEILSTPIPIRETFDDDPLRILRAIRFSITKRFTITESMKQIIARYDYDKKMPVVSTDRIRDELYKCFKHDSLLTMTTLCDFPKLARYIFDNTTLWLKPTTEKQ